jgi:RES domain-containing protein
LRIFRLARRAFFDSSAPFAGEGAYIAGSRWCTPGHYMSFASLGEALATLEYLVHLGERRFADDVVLIVAEIDEALVERLDRRKLRRGWDRSPPPIETQRLGDAWLASMASVGLRVPSAIVAHEENVLINSRHPDVGRIKIVSVDPWKLDPRLGAIESS